MKPDNLKTKFSQIRSRADQLTKRQKTIIAGSIGGVVLLIIISAITVSSLSNAAGEHAKTFDTELNEYVSKLEKTNKSIVQLKLVINQAPKLKDSAFGFMNDSYKKSQAKQAVLNVYQSEVFNYIPDFDGSKSYQNIVEDRATFTKRYNNNIPENVKDTTPPNDVKYEKQTALLQSKSRLSPMYSDFKSSVKNLNVGTYGERAKKYTLSIIDSAVRLEREYEKNIRNADTYADVRSLNKQHMMQMRYNDYDISYGVAAIYAMNGIPANVSAPAVNSLSYAVKNADSSSSTSAKEKAYATLYGYTAAYNTPKTTDTPPLVLNKLGLASYSLDRLSKIVAKSDNKALVERVQKAKKAYGLLPYGTTALKIPSASSRMDSLSEINGGLSSFDGYSDLVSDLESIGTSGERINGARVDFDAYEKVRSFARASYPSSLFPDEVKEYRRTVDICLAGYIKYHRAGEKVIEAQIKQAQKVATISKEIRQIVAGDSSSDTARLQDLRAQVRKATAEVNRLQTSLKPAEDQSKKDIANCGKEFVPAVQNLRKKTDNLPLMYNKSNTLARETYQKL